MIWLSSHHGIARKAAKVSPSSTESLPANFRGELRESIWFSSIAAIFKFSAYIYNHAK